MAFQEAGKHDCDGWNTYPVGIDCYIPPGTDRELCAERLKKDATRLFAESGSFEVVWDSVDSDGLSPLPSFAGKTNMNM
jgi:hypothetical protein